MVGPSLGSPEHPRLHARRWHAVLNEQGKLLRVLAGKMRAAGGPHSAARFDSRANEVERTITVLKDLVLSPGVLDTSEDDLVPS